MKVQIGDLMGAILDFSEDMKYSWEGRLPGLLHRGRAKHDMYDIKGAIADLTEAIKLEGEEAVFGPLYRGRVKRTAGDISGAIADFTAAIDAFPRLTNAYRQRADAKEIIGDIEGAHEDRLTY